VTFGRRHEPRDLTRWHFWWAWRPVQLKDGRWAWLERVGRRLICDAAFMDGSRYFEYGVP
jgi:hypothetical protein